MPCFRPLEAYRAKDVSSSGKRKMVFNRENAIGGGLTGTEIQLPCGQCVGCRLERSRQWAVRCMHEASLYDDNCFITLTYDSNSVPSDFSLDVSHFQRFMKRLRKRFGAGIRFFHCGEYGEKYGRPHFHALLFNFDFPDKILFKVVNDQRLFRSAILEKLWPFGHSSIGSLTFESAAYVARYIMKKVTGDLAIEHYKYMDPLTGEVFNRKPEYTTMSRRPGIARAWFDEFKFDVFPSDFITVNGKKCKPPKYYDSLFEHEYPDSLLIIKEWRLQGALKFSDNQTSERLDVREKVQLRKLQMLPRNLDKD